jgi:hypothetical protein
VRAGTGTNQIGEDDMAEIERAEAPADDRAALVEEDSRFPILPIAGGEDDDEDDDDDYEGDDGNDDTGEDDHNLSNQNPDSDD